MLMGGTAATQNLKAPIMQELESNKYPDNQIGKCFTLADLKEQNIQTDELTVYLLQQQLVHTIRQAKLIQLELKLRGCPVSEEQEQDINELSRKV